MNSKIIDSYNEYAEKWAKRMRSDKNYMHKYLEKPAMYKIITEGGGDLKNKTILCVGCGSGEECDALLRKGAKKVIGIDMSSGAIGQAKKAFPYIEFRVMDMEELDFDEESFDLVYSSLAMHYVESWTKMLSGVYRVLKPDGRYVFSIYHPITSGSELHQGKSVKRRVLGSETFRKDNSVKIFGDYCTERWIDDVWFGEFHVSFYHRPMESLLADIVDSDFELRGMYEPKAVKEFEAIDKASYEKRQKIPKFMIFDLSPRKGRNG